MNVEHVSTDNYLTTLRVKASSVEVADAFDRGLDSFLDQVGQASGVNLQELPGDTAEEKIRNAMDKATADQTIETAVLSWLIPQALSKENIIPVASADATVEGLLSHSLPTTFLLKVAAKPSYELSDYEPFTVTIPAKPEVTEEDVDGQIQMMLVEFARAKAAQEGTDPGKAEIPELTDEWCAENLTNLGVKSVAELRESFRHNAAHALADQYEQLRMAAIMDEYSKRFVGEIPTELCELVAKDMLGQLGQQVLGEGMELEFYLAQQDTTEEEVMETFKQQAYFQLKQGFILDAIYRHEALRLEIQDLMSLIHGMAPGNEEDAFNALQESGRAFLLKEGAERQKALQWIADHITVETV